VLNARLNLAGNKSAIGRLVKVLVRCVHSLQGASPLFSREVLVTVVSQFTE